MTEKKMSAPKGERRKATRKASWERGRERKELRKAAQAEREAANRAARRAGKPTAHELKIEAIKEKRGTHSSRIRTDTGNYLVKRVVIDEHGPVTIDGRAPCCSAKSYFKCKCTPKFNDLKPRQFMYNM